MRTIPWFKVDDGFHGHPKVISLSPEAVGIWTLTGSWCANYLTDGEVQANIVRRFGGTQEMIQELVDADLWIDNGDGTYQFKDWADYQPVKADVEAERAAARERMRQVRAQKKGITLPPKDSENVQANTPGTSEEVRVTPTQSQSLSQSPSQPSQKTSIPSDWMPTKEHAERAKEKNLDLHEEAEKFRNHALSVDRKAVRWNHAFTNWLIKAQPGTPEYSQTSNPSDPRNWNATAPWIQ